MYNQENAHTGNFARRSDKLVGETPAGMRTGSIAEFTRRMAAWLDWREGRAPKPVFKFYDPHDKSTWFERDEVVPNQRLRGFIKAQAEAAKARKKAQ